MTIRLRSYFIAFSALMLCWLAAMGLPRAQTIRTPPPGPKAQIHGPSIYGVRPGRPFLYRIPCTGDQPIIYGVKDLPSGLNWDPYKGIIRGTAPTRPGEYKVLLTARNQAGQDRKPFRIVVGENLALTPPMGWNHWYTWYQRVSDRLIRRSADSMIQSGMADFGYQYVSIDDCWMVKPGNADPMIGGDISRGPDGSILPNKHFPDMKGLTDYIHAHGLKAGIYSSPGPLTCAGYAASYQHEEADAKQFAAWGFDFLKYDWCSYGKTVPGQGLERAQKPYRLMGSLLSQLDRDLVLNLCQYGNDEVWKWGKEVGGHSWRTTGDLGLKKGDRLPGFYHIGRSNAAHYAFAGPGAWNDPDYILIGWVGNAHSMSDPPKQTTLSPEEQYSYMSMWSLMAAPLFYSGDINRLDPFTLNVLCNAEVIDVNQDALGKQARVLRDSEEEMVLIKPMEDGSFAVGLFNLSEAEKEISVSWNDLGVKGKQLVRDLWYQKDLGVYQDTFRSKVGRHDVVMIRLRAK